MAKETKQTCFVISPIGDEGSDIRKRSDQILEYVITPPVEACGFSKPIRADQISEPGMITSQVLQHIADDHLVVADLTGPNPNVFYELAIRHAIPKPFVQIIQKGEQIPFDVFGVRTVEVDHRDLNSVAAAKEDIQKQIESVMKMKIEDIKSPISASLELKFLRSSEDPKQRSVADFVSAVSDIRSSIAAIEEQLVSRERLTPSDSKRPLSRDVEYLLQRLRMKLGEVDADLNQLGAATGEQRTTAFLKTVIERLESVGHELADARMGVEKALSIVQLCR